MCQNLLFFVYCQSVFPQRLDPNLPPIELTPPERYGTFSNFRASLSPQHVFKYLSYKKQALIAVTRELLGGGEMMSHIILRL